MKKLFACVILSFLMISTLAISAFAAEALTVTLAGKESASQGTTITVTVSANAEKVKSIGVLEVKFNDKIFEFVSGKWLVDGIISDFNNTNQTGVFASVSEMKLSGEILSLTFNVLDDATRGSHDITAKISINNNEATADAKYTIAIGCYHTFDKKIETEFYLATPATCKDKATYYYSCSNCGEKGTETFVDEDGALGDHVYGTEYQTDKDKHWKECTLCQAKNGETAHTPGDEATATAPQTCTICKYIIKAAVTEHTHAWLDTWEKDATNHWHKCTGTDCTEKKDSAAHVFENDCDKTCDTCGYEREVTHKYGEKHSTDAQNHWYECSVCKDKKDSEAHKPGDAATATKDQTCTVCGYIIKKATGTETTAPHTHDVADSDWKSNASKHWKLCSCGEKIDQASHKWNAGKVKTEPTVDKEGEKVFTCTVCSATKTERIAKLDPPATSAPVETTEPVVETTEPSVETTDPAETTPSIDGTTEPVGTTGPIGTTGPVSTNPSNPSDGNGGSNVGTIIIVIIGIIVLLAAAAAVVLLMIGDSKSKSRRR